MADYASLIRPAGPSPQSQNVLNQNVLGSSNADQARMQSFLYEIVVRIVAIYLCVDCWQKIRNGLAEKKIAYVTTDLLNWLIFDWSDRFVFRDTAPISYWTAMGFQIFALAACLVVAIHGWWHANT
jgi:hypothetical protein